MPVSVLDRLTRQAVSHLITFYQKRLSPYKGFSCAHRVLQGGESCSQYTKRIILEQGLLRSRPFIRQRFQACKTANKILKTRRDRLRRRHKLQRQPTYPVLYPSLRLATPQLAPDFPDSIFRIEGESSPKPDLGQDLLDDSQLNKKQTKGMKDPALGNGASTGQWSVCDGLDCIDATCAGLECLPEFELGELSCDLSDCGWLDCSSLDCSSLDCGTLDCGSCG